MDQFLEQCAGALIVFEFYDNAHTEFIFDFENGCFERSVYQHLYVFVGFFSFRGKCGREFLGKGAELRFLVCADGKYYAGIAIL